ncbi:hypothetical protein C2W64_01371 [Brevibacillus laterosporus]|nr:M57 family metalloprotease [Brevibacillus laterosporus]RAP26655.1 hypothetical protein C2W64_01371 [Brevibacillus laterosporus]
MNIHKITFGSLVLLVSLTIANTAFAYETTGYEWESDLVRYNYANDLGSDYVDGLKGALSSWNNAVEKYIAFGKDTKKSRTFIYGEENYGKTGWNAETSVTPYKGSYYIQTASINPNSYYMDSMSAFDIQGVLGHELGHVLGLDHVTNKKQIMCTSAGGRKVNEPGSDDIAGIKSIYK